MGLSVRKISPDNMLQPHVCANQSGGKKIDMLRFCDRQKGSKYDCTWLCAFRIYKCLKVSTTYRFNIEILSKLLE